MFYGILKKFWGFDAQNKFSVFIEQKADFYFYDFLFSTAVKNNCTQNFKFRIMLSDIVFFYKVVIIEFVNIDY